MEALDVWEPNSALQPQAVSWATYPLDGYEPMLDEGVSDSESSFDSRPQALYFENCDVKSENVGFSANEAAYAAGNGAIVDAMGWSYAGDESLSSVMSPTSESDDTMRYGNAYGTQESGDETTHSGEDPSSSSEEEGGMKEYELEYQEGNHEDGAVKKEDGDWNAASTQQAKSSPTGRPVRSSARGEQMKQVQEMIRQVNSAVESTGNAGKAKSSGSGAASGSNSKKRARVEPDIRSVTLSREQLLTMTSEELDAFTERLKADHPLTPHEMRELKRQRRLIKNREYAQASRVKKKVVLSDLGVKFNELESERNALALRVQTLEIENSELRRQLGLDPSKRNLSQFIIGGSSSHSHNLPASSGSSNPFLSYKGGNGATNFAASGLSSMGSNDGINAASSTDGDYMFSGPKPKRAKGRQNGTNTGPSASSTFSSRAAVIGGGMSLFAVVLLAVAVFTGAGTPFFSTPISSPHSPIPTYPISSNAPQGDLKTDTTYNTFRTMDILATSPELPDPSLDPVLSTPNPSDTLGTINDNTFNTKDKQEVSTEPHLIATPTSTLVSMDELLAAEEMVYSTTNTSLPEEVPQQTHEETVQHQA